ncbi:hypothetical protein PUN28_013625 [Cardiocondyla obscurior]|uniref:Uncharacterized protein n=1 Tax=Cardiocondyla obscurior TaxID=286306 RepID=A0AAW2F5F2_9HYME
MSKSSGSSFHGSSARAIPSPVRAPIPATSSLQPPTSGLPCCCMMPGGLLASLSDLTLGLERLGVFGGKSSLLLGLLPPAPASSLPPPSPPPPPLCFLFA